MREVNGYIKADTTSYFQHILFRPDLFLNFENEIALLYNGGYRNTISKLKGVAYMTNKTK